MRVIALLSWYDESPTWLAATVASCRHFCDHIVALDGAFKYYPDGRASSGAEQQEAIVKTAEAVGLGVTVHVPARCWEGEIEKTNVRFRLGEAIAEPEVDWFFVIDADSVVIEAPPTVREDLQATPLDVGVISLADYIDWHSTPEFEHLAQTTFITGRHFSPLTCFFRAIPGIWCEGTHAHWFAVRNGEKLILRGSDDHDLVPPLDLGQVIVEHRQRLRTQDRRWKRDESYRRRDAFGVEPGFKVGPPALEESAA